MKVAICLLALVAIASASQVEALAEIKSQPLGNALLMAVHTSIDAGNTVEEVSRFLHQLDVKEQGNNDELRSDRHNELTQLDNTINTLKALISNLESDIKKLEGNIANNEKTLATTKTNLAAAEQDLKNTIAEFDRKTAAYHTAVKNLKDDIEASKNAHIAVKEAIRLVDKYQSAVASALVQIASEAHSGLNAFATTLTNLKNVIIAKSPESSALVHELIILCQAPKDAGNKSEKIAKLLAELEQRVATNWANERNNLDDTIKTYEEERAFYEGRIQRLQRDIAQMKAKIVSLAKLIKVQEAELKEKNEDLKDNKTMLANTQKLRAERAAYYAAAIKKSDANLAIMKKLIAAYDSGVVGTSYSNNAAKTGKGF